jgi:hypothetical protein
MAPQTLRRGMVFRAQHDDTFAFWGTDQPPRSKLGLVFNASPVSDGSDVQYFLTTTKVGRFRETPSILTDVLIVPAGTYPFWPEETLIDFRHLCIVAYAKLVAHHMTLKGAITDDHLRECEEIVAKARLLENRAKKLLALR